MKNSICRVAAIACSVFAALAGGCAVGDYEKLKEKAEFEVVVFEGADYDAAFAAALDAVQTHFGVVEFSKFAGVIVSDFRRGGFERVEDELRRTEYFEKALVGLDELGEGKIELRVAVTKYVDTVVDISGPADKPEFVRDYVAHEPDSYARRVIIGDVSRSLKKEPAEHRIIEPERDKAANP